MLADAGIESVKLPPRSPNLKQGQMARLGVAMFWSRDRHPASIPNDLAPAVGHKSPILTTPCNSNSSNRLVFLGVRSFLRC